MQPPSPGARPAASSESGGDAPVIVAASARVLWSALEADQAGLALRTATREASPSSNHLYSPYRTRLATAVSPSKTRKTAEDARVDDEIKCFKSVICPALAGLDALPLPPTLGKYYLVRRKLPP